jgi:hypothetical protein
MTNNSVKIFCLFVFILAFSTNLFPQTYSRIGLEVAYPKKLDYIIGVISTETEKFGLSKDTLKAVCEFNLKTKGIEPVANDSSKEFIFIGCAITGKMFSVNLQFKRIVEYKVGKRKYFMLGTTWSQGWNGTHGGKVDYVLKGINDLLNSFLKDYIEANPSVVKK